MPAPINTAVDAATEDTTTTTPPSSSWSSSTNWWIVVIIVLLSIAIVVVALLIAVWCRRIRRSGSIGVPTPVHTSGPFVTVSQVTMLMSCTMALMRLVYCSCAEPRLVFEPARTGSNRQYSHFRRNLRSSVVLLLRRDSVCCSTCIAISPSAVHCRKHVRATSIEDALGNQSHLYRKNCEVAVTSITLT